MSSSLPGPVEITRRFHPVGRLGEGAMGEVFAAIEPETGQRVAVKMLREELGEEPGAVGRFHEEAGIALAIDHPGSLPVYGIGVTPGGRPFYVMKEVRGRTLGVLLRERGRHVTDLHWRRRLLSLFQEICEVVGYAHDHGILHRDLKPDNVLVDELDTVTVIDWGLAKRITGPAEGAARTVLGDVLGSPGYMSPEQAAGAAGEAGPPADVFALGAILYEILTGDAPFSGATPREAMLAAIHRDPPELRRGLLRLAVPRSLAAVCRKALAKEPGARHRDAGELARDLRSLSRGRAASAVSPSPFERLRWAAKRRPISFAAAAAAAAGIGLVLVFVAFQHHLDGRTEAAILAQVELQDWKAQALAEQLRDLDRAARTARQPADRRRFELQRAELESRRLFYQLDALHRLRSLGRLRFLAADPRLEDLKRARAFEAVRSALDLGEPAMAKALALGMADDELDLRTVAMTATDRRRLQGLIRQADRAMAAEAAGAEPAASPTAVSEPRRNR